MTAGGGEKGHEAQFEVTDPDSQPVCRFCWSGECDEAGGELLAPCGCDGSMKYLHRRCLQQWQKRCIQVACRSGSHTATCAVLLQAVTHCSICKQRYSVPRAFSLGLSIDWARLVTGTVDSVSSFVKRAQLRWLIPCFAMAWLITFTWDAIATLTIDGAMETLSGQAAT